MEKAVKPGNADGLWIDTAIRLPLFISYNHNYPLKALCAASKNLVIVLHKFVRLLAVISKQPKADQIIFHPINLHRAPLFRHPFDG